MVPLTNAPAGQSESTLQVEDVPVLVRSDHKVTVRSRVDGATYQVTVDFSRLPASEYVLTLVYGDQAQDRFKPIIGKLDPYGIMATANGARVGVIFVFDEVEPLVDSRRDRGITEIGEDDYGEEE